MKKLGLLFIVLIMSVMFAVSASAVLATSIELPTTITIYVDEPIYLNPTITPENATNKSFTIKGSDYTYTYKEFILGGLLGTITKTDVCKFSDYIDVNSSGRINGRKATVTPKSDEPFYFTVTVSTNDGSNKTAITRIKVLENRHKGMILNAKPATCTQDGNKAGIKCSICGAILEGGETIPALGHKFSQSFTIDIEPTCTKNGLKSRHCLYCSATKDATVMNKKEHSYTAVVIEPTCTKEGYTVYTCVCSDNYTEAIPAKGHSFDGSVCKACGYNKTGDCSCKCHAGGIKAFFFKLINFFAKIFNPGKRVCACGIKH